MPRITDSLIQNLCNEALAAKTEDDVERIFAELRTTLEEHIRSAKESLGVQAATISMLDAKAARNSTPD